MLGWQIDDNGAPILTYEELKHRPVMRQRPSKAGSNLTYEELKQKRGCWEKKRVNRAPILPMRNWNAYREIKAEKELEAQSTYEELKLFLSVLP